jgi:mRNA-degrading endonuclease RelE of RelBE toxin-antitoxin system
MRYEIVLAPTAVRELAALPPHVRGAVRDAIERHLRHEPTRVSKSRIKRLRGLDRPQYRLRVDEVRVFYDVEEDAVHVLAIVSKAQAAAWLAAAGTPSPKGGAGEGEG